MTLRTVENLQDAKAKSGEARRNRWWADGPWTLASVLFLSACAAPPTPSDALGLTFTRIPAGEFIMGSDETAHTLRADFPFDDPKRYADLADEAPRHRVRITRDFEMARHEVTVGQFRAFVQASGHVPESIADGTGGFGYNAAFAQDVNRTGDAFEGRDPQYSWQWPGFVQGDDHPVTNVTWRDAVAMARWLSAREGRTYRLPTEAEWEYACRAGQSTRFQTGDDPRALTGAANLFDQDAAAHWPKWKQEALAGRDGFAFTAPVGRFAPNAFGLFDMHGNVWEWTSDWYGEDWYARSPTDDPQGPATGDVRVRRGGSWHTWPLYARCAYRNINTEATRYPLVGFRLVRELR
ncbi:MAG: formylglycine-generating enzyme family protein [Burkholderiales bacterium]|nr:formylglycine-generating enzyme family protein [Burkholderiales bacterium]